MVATREEGIIEIVISDPGQEFLQQVKKYDTAVDFPAITENNPTERPWLEYGIGRPVLEDEYIMLYFTPRASDNVTYNDSKISIPITKYNTSLNTVSTGALTGADFDDWLAAGDTGIPCTAGTRTYLGKFKVGAKQVVKLGNYTAENSLDKANGRILAVVYDDTP